MISIQNLNKTYENIRALNNVSFEVAPGTLCGLLGPNGAGKSTLFKILMGLLLPDSGRIRIQDQEIQFGETRYKQLIGYVPENPILYDYLTGSEFLKFAAAAKHLSGETADQEIRHWLTFFQIEKKADELITNYSNGMKRKLSLSTALLGRPPILLLDEATNGLDPESSYHLKQYLTEFTNSGGAVIFSSHIIETVEKLCDQVIILHKGEIRKQLEQKDWLIQNGQNTSLETIFMNLIQ